MRVMPYALAATLVWAQAPGPKLQLDRLHFDFGTMEDDQTLTCTFTLTNVGKAPLSLLSVRPSCGCTSLTQPNSPLPPGASVPLTLSLDTKGMRGKVHKTIHISTNDPSSPETVISLEATILRRVVAEPGMAFFPDITQGSRPVASIRLIPDRAGEVRITRVSHLPYLRTAFRTEGGETRIEVTLDESRLPPRRMEGSDTLSLTLEQGRTVALPVQWMRKAYVQCNPDRLSWVEPPGVALGKRVQLWHVDARRFRILKAAPSHPWIQVLGLSQKAANRHEVQVLFSPTAPPGHHAAKVTFTLDAPDHPCLDLPIHVILKEQVAPTH